MNVTMKVMKSSSTKLQVLYVLHGNSILSFFGFGYAGSGIFRMVTVLWRTFFKKTSINRELFCQLKLSERKKAGK